MQLEEALTCAFELAFETLALLLFGEELLRRPGESAALVLTVSPEAFSTPLVATLTARWVGERFDIDPLTFERRREGKRAVLYEVVAEDTAEEFTSTRRRRHSAYR